MPRTGDCFRRLTDFDDPTLREDRNPVGHMFHYSEVMRNKEIAQTKPVSESIEQVENLRLNRDIKCRDRLIGDDETRFGCDSPGNAHSLPLSSTQPPRSLIRQTGIEANLLNQLSRSVRNLVRFDDSMNVQRFFYDLSDRGMSRALLKLSGSLVHDYATISDDSPSPNRASRARRAATSAGIS